MNEITIVGFTQPHFLSICDILNSLYLTPKIYLFDNQKRYSNGLEFINFEIVDNLIDKKNLLLCFANPTGKYDLIEKLGLNSKSFINLFHKSSEISNYSYFGSGIRIEPLVCIANNTTVEDYVNINRNSSIGHDCFIGKYTSINPSVSISGGVYVGERTQIGTGSKIINNIKIGDNVFIGAGSVVTKNIPDNVVAYGNPCKIIRENV